MEQDIRWLQRYDSFHRANKRIQDITESDKKADDLDFSSPDNTLDGNLKKRWKIIGGKRKG